MAAIIQPELVESTWQHVGALESRAVLKIQQQAGKFQPEVVGFVLGFTSELRGEAMGIALYAMLVVLEMFRAAPVRKIVKVKDSTILRHWRENQRILSTTSESGAPALAAVAASSTEPYVVQYIVEALTDREQEDRPLLTDTEIRYVLSILKTASDSLHDACRD